MIRFVTKQSVQTANDVLTLEVRKVDLVGSQLHLVPSLISQEFCVLWVYVTFPLTTPFITVERICTQLTPVMSAHTSDTLTVCLFLG